MLKLGILCMVCAVWIMMRLVWKKHWRTCCGPLQEPVVNGTSWFDIFVKLKMRLTWFSASGHVLVFALHAEKKIASSFGWNIWLRVNYKHVYHCRSCLYASPLGVRKPNKNITRFIGDLICISGNIGGFCFKSTSYPYGSIFMRWRCALHVCVSGLKGAM